ITSGLVVGFVLEKENAINDYRELIGSTNPKEAHIGTVRSDYGIETSKNSVHGSDCESSVIKETKVFFA
ncbi:MAG: nucleoside-diphosphate kinase, partial [Psittacicella sp.]